MTNPELGVLSLDAARDFLDANLQCTLAIRCAGRDYVSCAQMGFFGVDLISTTK